MLPCFNFYVWAGVGRGKMQFKAVLYANRMYTVCHAVAYSSSRNIYCFVLSELYNFLSLYTCLYIFDSNEIIGEDNNFDDHLFCQNVSRQLLKCEARSFCFNFSQCWPWKWWKRYGRSEWIKWRETLDRSSCRPERLSMKYVVEKKL